MKRLRLICFYGSFKGVFQNTLDSMMRIKFRKKKQKKLKGGFFSTPLTLGSERSWQIKIFKSIFTAQGECRSCSENSGANFLR